MIQTQLTADDVEANEKGNAITQPTGFHTICQPPESGTTRRQNDCDQEDEGNPLCLGRLNHPEGFPHTLHSTVRPCNQQ